MLTLSLRCVEAALYYYWPRGQPRAQVLSRGGGVLNKISDKGLPPTVSRSSRRLDQFL